MQKMNRFQFLAGLLALGAALPAAARDSIPMLTVQHARGQAQVPAAPRRVVVYDLASLDTMQALGLPVAGVPRAGFPAYMAGYADARYSVAGTLFEPDYEALSRIRPDLIVVAGRSAARYDTLSRIAPTLDLSVGARDMLGDMQRNVAALASLWGRQAEGERLMRQVRDEVEAFRAQAVQAGPGLLVLAIDTHLSAQPPGARFGLLHDVLGVPPALPPDPAMPRGVPLRMEEIAKIDPQWLYVIDRNAGTGTAVTKEGKPVTPSKTLFDNDLIRGTTAARKGQVVFLDPQIWYLLGSAGPLAMRANVAQLRAALASAR